jgi:aspartate beta-hydroxylase
MDSAYDNSLIDSLAEARRLVAAGRYADSVRSYERALRFDPQQVEALNAVALWALRHDDTARALELLRSALAVAPDDPLTHYHLSQALQAVDDTLGAVRHLWNALERRPVFFLARLAMAECLEKAGRRDLALPHYFRAITDAQKEGRWRSAETTPPALQDRVRHAMQVVDTGRSELYHGLFESWVSEFGRSELTRVRACLDGYLGERRVELADPEQRPTFLYFPGLPAAPFVDLRRVPQMQELAEQTADIRAELLEVIGSETGREAVFPSAALAAAHLAHAEGRASWNGYYFHRHGRERAENIQSCPATFRALERLPLCRVRDHGPETLFSVLSPGTHLLPHRGVTNTRLVGHLGLIVPPDCRLSVSGREYAWREGETVLFDDTYSHEAWNRSERDRIVLIFDLWHPDLSEAERRAVGMLVEAAGDLRLAADRRPEALQ